MTNREYRSQVTPAQAAKWLEKSNYEDNRKIRPQWVDHLARQMTKGLWRYNGEPLIFSTAGLLLDGQHRLAAIVSSGKAQTFLVVEGIAEGAFTTLDQNLSRSAAQVLAMKGFKNTNTLASIARCIFCWEMHGAHKHSAPVSPDEILLVMDCYEEEIRDAVEAARELVREVPAQMSIAGFCRYLFMKASAPKCKVFFEVLRDGVASSKGHPAIALRNRLFKAAGNPVKERINPYAYFALWIRAWNAHMRNETLLRSFQVKPAKDGTYKVPPIRGLGNGQAGKGRPKNGTSRAGSASPGRERRGKVKP